MNDTHEIDPHNTLPIPRGKITHLAAMAADAGIVEQIVDYTVLIYGIVDQPPYGIDISDIHNDGVDLSSAIGNGAALSFQPFPIDVRSDDGGARTR